MLFGIERPMEKYLQWIDERRETRSLAIEDRLFIGRVCPGIDPRKRILLSDPVVSRNHAEITFAAGRFYICDTSTNGTWVNGVRVTPGSSREIFHGDIIRIGDTAFTLVCPSTETEAPGADGEMELTRITQLEVPVTSLVADIKGFTEFSRFHDSSEVYELVKILFARFSAIVEDCHGTVKDFAGDAIFAFWEHAGENQREMALGACRAALGQMAVLSGILREFSERIADVATLNMGWGVTTGKATIAHYGSRNVDLALVGDSINLAFRLSSLGGRQLPEKILLCEKTAALVKRDFEIMNLGPVSIKGRAEPEPVFALKPPPEPSKNP